MRKLYSLLLLAAMCASAATVAAQEPSQRLATPTFKNLLPPTVLKVQTEAEFAASHPKAFLKQEDILVEEDFASLSSGTDEQPDTLNCLADADNLIDPSLTHGQTWGGDKVYAAGSAICLSTYEIMRQATLFTPLNDYSGKLTVTLRCKALPAKTLAYDDNGELVWVTLTGSSLNILACAGGYEKATECQTDDSSGAEVRLYAGQGWTYVTYEFDNYTGDDQSFIEFSTEGTVVIDDIRITADPTVMGMPAIRSMTDLENGSFTMEWSPVRKAFNYYIDLYKKVYTSEECYHLEEDFESYLNDGTWEVDEAQIVAGKGREGSKALQLEKGESITVPGNGTKMKNLCLWMKVEFPETANEDDMWSAAIDVEALTDKGWQSWTSLYAYYFQEEYPEEGVTNDIDMEVESWNNFANRFYSIRFCVNEVPDGTKVYFDNFVCDADRSFEMVPVKGKNSSDYGEDSDYTKYDTTEETSYTFSKLDDNAEYFCGVRSHYTAYFSKRQLHAVHAVGGPSAVSGIVESMPEDAVPVAFYGLDGRQQQSLQKGVNVVKMKNGHTRIVIK